MRFGSSGQGVTVCLSDEIDVSRGDVLAAADDPPEVADHFEAHIVWMHEHQMLPGRPYLVKIGTRIVGATIDHPKYRVNVNTLEHAAAKQARVDQTPVALGLGGEL